ncbi:NYN domain-containing protein [Candidatus Woesearchaeota archaeon CG10_big_fil_rev_8_21_14_0_10_34_12]|nr:MAG: NYN domain-containing protein [Candidatus Woesearchaeota archaeon CG10_big_fil_rev_8_21_14_0_10_34_12]
MSDSEKCAIFINGSYINKILKSQFSEAKVDYLKFSEKICSDLKLRRLRTYFYHCLPLVRNNNPQDISRKANMQKFLANLKRLPIFEIKLGKLQIIRNQFKQKMIDVLMSLDTANISYEKQVQHIILIAGDSDFIPAIKKAKDCGIITHLFYNPSSVHNEILDEIDEIHIINTEFVGGCRIE